MINESNIVCLNFLKADYFHKFGMISKTFYLSFQNCKHYVPILYTLDVEGGSPISHKNH